VTMVRFERETNRTLDVVVTGTGRCGTAFAARWLVSVGISAGHEMFFSHGGLPAALKALARRAPDVIADCAWEAAPYLSSAPLKNALLIHQVRHPKRVIESCMRSPVGHMPRYEAFAYRNLPGIMQYTGNLDRSAFRWIHWNRMIEKECADRPSFRWRIEDGQDGLLWWLDEQEMVNARTIHPAQLFSNMTMNHHRGEPVEVRIGDIAPDLRYPLLEMAAQYGYDRWE